MAGLRPKGYRRPEYLAGLRYRVAGVRIRRYARIRGEWFYATWEVR